MRTRINLTKYNNKWDMHTIDETGKAIRKDAEKIERQNKTKEICLTCTKKKCRGTDKCFAKERSKNGD